MDYTGLLSFTLLFFMPAEGVLCCCLLSSVESWVASLDVSGFGFYKRLLLAFYFGYFPHSLYAIPSAGKVVDGKEYGWRRWFYF